MCQMMGEAILLCMSNVYSDSPERSSIYLTQQLSSLKYRKKYTELCYKNSVIEAACQLHLQTQKITATDNLPSSCIQNKVWL